MSDECDADSTNEINVTCGFDNRHVNVLYINISNYLTTVCSCHSCQSQIEMQMPPFVTQSYAVDDMTKWAAEITGQGIYASHREAQSDNNKTSIFLHE